MSLSYAVSLFPGSSRRLPLDRAGKAAEWDANEYVSNIDFVTKADYVDRMNAAKTKPEFASLTDDVYHRLRAELLSCRIEPGARLKIAQLAERMGTSPGAIREALSRLTSEGLVTAEPQRGFRAAAISTEELLDLTNVRVKIEALCLSRAIEVGDLTWEAAVVAATHELSRTERYADGDPNLLSEAWEEAHRNFHDTLAAGCDSPILLQIRRQLYAQSGRYRRLSIPLAESERDLNAEHRALMQAVILRDKDLAERAISQHIGETTRILLNRSGQLHDFAADDQGEDEAAGQ